MVVHLAHLAAAESNLRDEIYNSHGDTADVRATHF